MKVYISFLKGSTVIFFYSNRRQKVDNIKEGNLKWWYLLSLQGIEFEQKYLILKTNASFKQSQIWIKNEIFYNYAKEKKIFKNSLYFLRNILS